MEDSEPQYEQEAIERRLPKGQPWEVDIDVYLYDASDPKDGFKVKSVLPIEIDDSDPPIEYIIFENKGRPGFKLLFHLHDETGQNYQFAENKDDAIWSREGDDKCPDEAEHAVLEPVRVKDGTLLVVKNENDEKDGKKIGKFRYTLRVGKGGKPPYIPLDPGGVDQDGPRRPIFR